MFEIISQLKRSMFSDLSKGAKRDLSRLLQPKAIRLISAKFCELKVREATFSANQTSRSSGKTIDGSIATLSSIAIITRQRRPLSCGRLPFG
jgi:hypothetical protein